jgi:hypothetical protein
MYGDILHFFVEFRVPDVPVITPGETKDKDVATFCRKSIISPKNQFFTTKCSDAIRSQAILM